MATLLKHAAQLENHGILLGSGVARMPALSGGGSGWVVVLVVLGVELQLFCWRGSHIVLFVCGLGRIEVSWKSRAQQAVGADRATCRG